MCAADRVNELGSDAHPVRRRANAAFEHIAHAKFATDLFNVNSATLVNETRIAGDYKQLIEARQSCDDFFDHSVGKIFLSGIPAHVLKWQHSNRRLVR
jgi:hypothetical protein